jgi:hypothetical protein
LGQKIGVGEPLRISGWGDDGGCCLHDGGLPLKYTSSNAPDRLRYTFISL